MKLRLTPRARQDRLRIFDYLVAQSESGASSVMSALQRTFEVIEQFPEGGRRTDGRPIRCLTVSSYPYVVFYRVRVNMIEVIHIRHTSRRPWAG
ncbi:type II toxin-antitoxin system RelE/ParE family toxin [uncultured Enterovirga sp.]|uniref:type II toxin-antitoxin system RelE/ParE family toxin n=1 Tax=uncultured Enterovirga sp. TaxID=2026352 RepID=UPI0035C99DF6